jgi:hypothetical protein
VILSVKLHAEPGAPKRLCRNQRRTGAAERIEIAALRKGLNLGKKNGERLLRRMQLVAAIGPVDDIADRRLGNQRIAFRQKVGALMLVAEVLFRRGITLRKNEVTGDPEAHLAPRLREAPDDSAEEYNISGQLTSVTTPTMFGPTTAGDPKRLPVLEFEQIDSG